MTALTEFYNGLSEGSIRTFRPLGPETTCERVQQIARANIEPAANYDLLAWQDGRVVGWGFIWNLSDERPTFGLGVADAYQGQGIGSLLMDAVMQEAERRRLSHVYLTVVRDNDVARQMYARRGFVQYDERYHEGDQLVYRRMVWHSKDMENSLESTE